MINIVSNKLVAIRSSCPYYRPYALETFRKAFIRLETALDRPSGFTPSLYDLKPQLSLRLRPPFPFTLLFYNSSSFTLASTWLSIS